MYKYKNYNLSFISDEDLFNHVKETVVRYRIKVTWNDFKKNIFDPIKFSFDSLIYKQNLDELIEGEIIRQIDKTNTNNIGYFHQNIFKYIGGEEWIVPTKGFDLINEKEQIYVEIKNKHNTMNSSSSQKTYIRMQHQFTKNPTSKLFLLEIIAKKSQDIPWKISLDGENSYNDRIRRISADKFYERVTGDKLAFYNLCKVLPKVIKDVVAFIKAENIIENTVIQELKSLFPNIETQDYLFELYKIAFKSYEGF